MARNKITFEKEWDSDTRRTFYHFTGSMRAPTLVEVANFIWENRLQDEMDDYFGVAHLTLKTEEWRPPEQYLTLTFAGYEGGSGDGTCPVCGHEHDMSGDRCPICLKKWDE